MEISCVLEDSPRQRYVPLPALWPRGKSGPCTPGPAAVGTQSTSTESTTRRASPKKAATIFWSSRAIPHFAKTTSPHLRPSTTPRAAPLLQPHSKRLGPDIPSPAPNCLSEGRHRRSSSSRKVSLPHRQPTSHPYHLGGLTVFPRDRHLSGQGTDHLEYQCLLGGSGDHQAHSGPLWR